MSNRSIWRIAGTVFQGGTEQIKLLVGRRVRARRDMPSARVHNPDPDARRPELIDKTIAVNAQSLGFVANPDPFDPSSLLIALANTPNSATSLKDLTRRGDFTVITVNSPTFKEQFEIEG